ncbi:MAG: hypothetical protein HC799_10050 [Limnothrix sp. RL_2_0]|nr:hypothetical protein [Limnothrix sp. RL_2_0]
MSPRKLTETDKEELLVAYRETAETTSTLAERYGVSSSTISRFLKSRLSVEEYEDLIQKKRLGRSNSVKKAKKKTVKTKNTIAKKSKTPKPKLVKDTDSLEPKLSGVQEEPVQNSPVVVEAETVQGKPSDSSSRRRTRTRQARPSKEDKPAPVIIKADKNRSKPELSSDFGDEDDLPADTLNGDDREVNSDLLALAQEISLGDRQQALKELLGDDISDEDDEDEDDDYNDDGEDQEEEPSANTPLDGLEDEEVQILPLASARFPRTCYVVTDKMSELIARPMREFRDLGHIPEEESTKRTLPIFDNHRVAKRFTHGRSQKVIKVTDGSLFIKTSTCLTAKGITRILLGGQIYDLSL